MTREEFTNLVRDAYSHLYDLACLQTHPLATVLVGPDDLSPLTRAQRLRQLLLDTLEELRPPDSPTISPEAGDCYHAVHYRYLDGLSPEQIAEMLALSPRQTYRKIREGIEAVASLLADRARSETPQDGAVEPSTHETSDRRALAQASVDQLGSYAQVEATELGAVLESIVKDMGPYCGQIGAEIRLLTLHTDSLVSADRTMLRQALINLLSSELDQAAGRTLTIQVSEAQSEAMLLLSWQPQDLGADAARVPKERQGIGLDVAMRLFDIQGIRVQRTSGGEGWRIRIRTAATEPHHVLIIDDMPDVLRLFQRYAQPYSVEMISAGNAEQAFDALQHVTPSLILLDVMLPRRDGWEILQTLKSDPSTSQIPVVVCSILNEPELAASLGADDYLCKPVTQEAFLKMLSRWLALDQRPVAAQQ